MPLDLLYVSFMAAQNSHAAVVVITFVLFLLKHPDGFVTAASRNVVCVCAPSNTFDFVLVSV